MTQINISLPPAVEEYLHQQITQKGYKNLEDYIYHLILEDQKHNTQEKLETMLIDGLDSGTPIPITEDWWEQKRAELKERLETASTQAKPTEVGFKHSIFI